MTLKQFSFKSDGTLYIAPTWEEVADLCFDVAKKINESNGNFDELVTLAKGGWPMACSLVDLLDIKHVSSLGIKFYTGIGERMDTPEIYQELPGSLEGKDVLLFDDISDSGKSLEYALGYLKRLKAKSVTTVTLFFKPNSGVEPDYWIHQTNAWIILPFEVRETVTNLKKKWSKLKIRKAEMIDRFKKLGFKEEEIKYFLEK